VDPGPWVPSCMPTSSPTPSAQWPRRKIKSGVRITPHWPWCVQPAPLCRQPHKHDQQPANPHAYVRAAFRLRAPPRLLPVIRVTRPPSTSRGTGNHMYARRLEAAGHAPVAATIGEAPFPAWRRLAIALPPPLRPPNS
jgi:hypothetical protein